MRCEEIIRIATAGVHMTHHDKEPAVFEFEITICVYNRIVTYLCSYARILLYRIL